MHDQSKWKSGRPHPSNAIEQFLDPRRRSDLHPIILRQEICIRLGIRPARAAAQFQIGRRIISRSEV